MAKKAFLQIKDAEAQAQALIKNAQDEAVQIIKRAEEETANALLRLSETSRQQSSEMKRQAETAAGEDNNAFSKETEEQCADLKQKLLLRKPKAIEAVIQLITAQSAEAQ